MQLEKFFPSPVLMPYIKTYMILESDQEIGNKIIPDTSVVMALRYQGKVMFHSGENEEVMPASVVSGLRRSARDIYYAKGTANLLVVFNEGGVTAFSKIPAYELFDLSIPSENIFPAQETHEVLEKLAEAGSNKDRIIIIEQYLTKKLINGKPDLLVGGAVQAIQQAGGTIRVKDLSKSLYISQDAFEKRFRAQVGSTPKQYASIIRLRNLITRYSSYRSLSDHPSLTEASYEAGYFDQSHFIKDFRAFTGQTPREFFKSYHHM